MLTSHLLDNMQHIDPPLQFLYDCTMLLLDVCVFCHGLAKDAHNALLIIHSNGQAK